MKKLSSLVLVLTVALTGSAFAVDFGAADALFSQRENSLTNIAQARTIYQQALRQSSGDDLVYAADHLGKLAYYEGELLTDPKNHSRRVEIFQQCQDDMESISPAKLGKKVPAYFYWKATCTALWAKSASSFSVPGRVGALESAMDEGAKLDGSFAGGGIYRVMGSVYLKSKMLSWIPGLGRFYDPAKALDCIEKAIGFGPQYYNAYLVKAEILKELGRGDEGLQLLQEKKRELDGLARRNSLPAGLEPESKMILRQMSDLMKNW